MNRCITILVIACSMMAGLHAQDVDPFFAGRSPLLLDPSRAGFTPGIRTSFIHQDQWLQFPGSWQSELLSVDWCARNTKKQVSSWMGLGLNATRETQGAVGSKLTSAGLLPAMHLRAGQRSYLSAGIELRWVNGTFGDATGGWGSQYDGLRYDASLPSGEAWNNDNSAWVEARAGLSFTVKQDVESPRRRERDLLVVGVAADHLGRLVLYEGGGPPPKIPVRITAYALGELPHEIWDDGFFAAELIAHYQGPFHTGRFNVYAGKHLLNRSREAGTPMPIGFKAGLGYRYRDALLVNTAMDFGSATIGLAYGWSLFNPNTMAAGRRTVELMVQLQLGG
jgi:hypothetical protein